MKISVAMTIYNGETYLIEQLDSIRKQSRQVDEVIICDDLSSDGSAQLLISYIDRHNLGESWKYYRNVENLGYATNFYEAVVKTRGDFVFFCDQDDIWIEDRVEKMINIMENNLNIQVLGSEFEPFYVTDDAPIIAKSVMRKMLGDGSLEHIQLNRKTIFIGSEGCTMCIRKSFFDKIERFWFVGWAHDEYVWKLALCIDGCYIYHQPTLKRRLHSNNVSKGKMRDLNKRVKFLEDLYCSHELMLKYANEVRLSTNDIDLIKKNMKSVGLRIDLLREARLINSIKLIFGYINNYHSRKSILVEFMMAIKGI